MEPVSFRNTLKHHVGDVSVATGNSRSWGRLYVLAVLLGGCVVLGICIREVGAMDVPVRWWALVALTMIGGTAVLKIPSIPANFSISDVFTLTTAVVFGPAAGTVVVAIDSLMISGRLIRTGLPRERLLFNVSAPAVAMWLSSNTFFRASGLQPLYLRPLGLEIVGPWLLAFAALYFFLNTFAIAVAVGLHDHVSAVAIWRKHFKSLWVTFLGGALGAAFVVFALQLGTAGLVVLALPLLLAVILHFAYRNAMGRVADQLTHLAEMNRQYLSTIEALARAVDAKDGVTHDHVRRVQSRTIALAKRLGVRDELQLRAIEAAALLHDIGKLAIPEHILNKPGRLTPAEYERMKTHAALGAEILSEVDFPYPVVPIVRHHHENWDGTGYPDGLKGADIPIGARILSVVDCFDALTSDRPYRRALSLSETFEIVDARRGTMYDPDVVDEFREMIKAGTNDSDTRVTEEVVVRPAPAVHATPAPDCAADGTRDQLQVALALGASLVANGGGRRSWVTLLDTLCRLPEVDTAALLVVDEGERLIPLHMSGAHAHLLERLSMAVGERMSGWVVAASQPMINGDAALDLFDTEATSLRNALAIPCQGHDGMRGVLTLYSIKAGAFTAFHQRLVEGAIRFIADAKSAAAPVATLARDQSIPTPQVRHGRSKPLTSIAALPRARGCRAPSSKA